MKKTLFLVTAILFVALGYWLGNTDDPTLIKTANAADTSEDELLVSPT